MYPAWPFLRILAILKILLARLGDDGEDDQLNCGQKERRNKFNVRFKKGLELYMVGRHVHEQDDKEEEEEDHFE